MFTFHIPFSTFNNIVKDYIVSPIFFVVLFLYHVLDFWYSFLNTLQLYREKQLQAQIDAVEKLMSDGNKQLVLSK